MNIGTVHVQWNMHSIHVIYDYDYTLIMARSLWSWLHVEICDYDYYDYCLTNYKAHYNV